MIECNCVLLIKLPMLQWQCKIHFPLRCKLRNINCHCHQSWCKSKLKTSTRSHKSTNLWFSINFIWISPTTLRKLKINDYRIKFKHLLPCDVLLNYQYIHNDYRFGCYSSIPCPSPYNQKYPSKYIYNHSLQCICRHSFDIDQLQC